MTSTIELAVFFSWLVRHILATFNEAFLNVALNHYVDMSVNAGVVQWVTTAYMLAAAVMVPFAGFLALKVRTSRLMALSWFCWSPALSAGRTEFRDSGCGARERGTGMIVPVGESDARCSAEEQDRRLHGYHRRDDRSPAFGPIVAGALLAHGTCTLFSHSPPCSICLVCSVLWVGDIAQLTHPHIDALSVVLAAIGLIGLLYGVSTVFSGQLVAAVVALVIGVVALVVFVLRQRRIPEPFLNLSRSATARLCWACCWLLRR